MKLKILIGLLTFITSYGFAQTITFGGGCPAAFGNTFTLSITGTVDDGGTIRNTWEATPIDFTQGCNSGTCEIRIIWSISNSRWEIQFDNGNDGVADLPNPDYDNDDAGDQLYYNTEASYPNPPSLTLGTWVDALGGTCGGNLTTANATLTGDVQDTTLKVSNLDSENVIKIYPNPVSRVLNLDLNKAIISSVSLYDLTGKIVLYSKENIRQLDVSKLQTGFYILEIKSDKVSVIKKILIK